MRVVCRHGHFAFYPEAKTEVARFNRLFAKLPTQGLVRENDYFTFPGLADLPRWSIAGLPYLSRLGAAVGITTFEGPSPWDAMRANGFVYSLMLGTLVPFLSVVGAVVLQQGSDCAVAPMPLIQPGLVVQSGTLPPLPLLGYHGTLDLNYQRLYIYALEKLGDLPL